MKFAPPARAESQGRNSMARKHPNRGVSDLTAPAPNRLSLRRRGAHSVASAQGPESSCRGGKMTAPQVTPGARSLFTGPLDHPAALLPGFRSTYRTDLGAAYAADSLELMKALPDGSVNAVITSPPYALHFKKEYGN